MTRKKVGSKLTAKQKCKYSLQVLLALIHLLVGAAVIFFVVEMFTTYSNSFDSWIVMVGFPVTILVLCIKFFFVLF